MKRFAKEQENKYKKKLSIVTIALVSVLGIMFIFQVLMANWFSTYGERIQELNVKKSELVLQNQILENQIAERTSMARVEESASSIGFTKIENILYVKTSTLAVAN